MQRGRARNGYAFRKQRENGCRHGRSLARHRRCSELKSGAAPETLETMQ